jgi:hypothetical protein
MEERNLKQIVGSYTWLGVRRDLMGTEGWTSGTAGPRYDATERSIKAMFFVLLAWVADAFVSQCRVHQLLQPLNPSRYAGLP